MVSGVAADLARARTVKNKMAQRLFQAPEVIGVGLTRRPGGWAVKVNLLRPAPHLNLPSQIDGVEIVTDETGPIVAR